MDEAAMALPSLTVAISTRGRRALGLDPSTWTVEPGLDWLLLVQEHEANPGLGPALDQLAARPNVTVMRLGTTGLSRSRNAALEFARGEILLIADDDVRHLPGAYGGIRAFFAENPAVSLLAGQSFDPVERPRKCFASRPRRLRRWNAGVMRSTCAAARRDRRTVRPGG